MIVVCGFGIGLGLCMMLWSWRTHRESAITFTVRRFAVAPTDLEAGGRDLRSVAVERLLGSVAGSMAPIIVFVVGAGVGASPPLPMVLWSSLALAMLGFRLPVRRLRVRAEAARRDFRLALSAYLDLVSVLLSGGAGIETALVAGARVGSGPSFESIQRSLDVARATRRSPWDELSALGARIGVDELPELAASIRLGGEQGARMTASLVARAKSMRAKHLADIEARANSATERMGLPMVVIFLAFLLLLGFPAVTMISAGFGS